MAEKPTGKKPPASAEPDPNEPGRLERDDRGNVTWQWSDAENLTADDTLGAAERLRALVDPGLDVQDEQENPLSPVQNNTKGLKTGYNPYNSGALGKQAWKKKKDLRRLSEWIELRKKMEGKKEE
ncbi:MAG TPA: hypothetical protein VF055_13430 [Steroidobacteraceae bacterium]